MAILNILSKTMILALAVTSHALSTTRYTQAIPAGAVVVGTREDLNAAVKANPATILDDVDNGFHLIDDKGKVIAVASDELIPELEDAFKNADAASAKDELEGNVQESKRDNALALAPQACAHRRCFNSIICVTYKDCHICGSNKKCI